MSDVTVNGFVSPMWQDDAAREQARNGQPAAAAALQAHVANLNSIAYSGRPCFSWISNGEEFNGGESLSQVYFPQNFGALREHAAVIYMPLAAFDPASFTVG